MIYTYEDIIEALEILSLPKYITRNDVKKRYRYLAKMKHPDLGGSQDEMDKINRAYELIIWYIDNFKYAFDEIEVKKQSPHLGHVQRFKP